jgi:hypothetical protein
MLRSYFDSARRPFQSIFGIHIDFLSGVQGGFFLRKKPLSIVLSVYTHSENAIAVQPFAPSGKSSRLLCGSPITLSRNPLREAPLLKIYTTLPRSTANPRSPTQRPAIFFIGKKRNELECDSPLLLCFFKKPQ